MLVTVLLGALAWLDPDPLEEAPAPLRPEEALLLPKPVPVPAMLPLPPVPEDPGMAELLPVPVPAMLPELPPAVPEPLP